MPSTAWVIAPNVTPPVRRANGYGAGVGCILVLLALFSPRLALIFLWLFSDLLSRAFEAWYIPLIGLFLLPWTTLAYAVLWTSSDRVYGFEWFIVGLAFVFDVASWKGNDRFRTQRA